MLLVPVVLVQSISGKLKQLCTYLLSIDKIKVDSSCSNSTCIEIKLIPDQDLAEIRALHLIAIYRL